MRRRPRVPKTLRRPPAQPAEETTRAERIQAGKNAHYTRLAFINSELARGGLVPIASGQGHDAAISIRQSGALLLGGRLKTGERVQLPDAPFVHLFVAKGSVSLAGADVLDAGDAARITATPGLRMTAGTDGAEVLIWEMHARIAA